MNVNQIKRCAVYTRKSTDEGLEQKFNSLDAQRESCAAYIRSMESLGWRLVEKNYDDGGYTGGNTERPALRSLMKDIENGEIDIVVVYKLDRLSRKLTDFVTLFKVFEAHEVSFVSVTQQIDTSSAMGRMMLNILMSFAQFEREQSADRVRDKVYATKKKGLWTGGNRPYGYMIVDKQLRVDAAEAPGVRMMFERYLATGSSFQVASELNRSSYRRADGGVWISRHVMQVLVNPLYIGKVRYRKTGETFDGAHDAIVDADMFARVNAMIAERGAERGVAGRPKGKPGASSEPFASPLLGLLRCGVCGGAMTTAASRCKPGTLKRYYYYRCMNKTKGRTDCDIPNMAADVMERLVRDALMPFLNTEAVVDAVAGASPSDRAEYASMIADGDGLWNAMIPAERLRLFTLLVKEIRVFADHMEISFTFDPAVRVVRFDVRRDNGRVCVQTGNAKEGETLCVERALRQAHAWVDDLSSGRHQTRRDLGRAIGVHPATVTRFIHFDFLSPRIVEAIMRGELPEISITQLSAVKSPIWSEQEKALGIV